MDSMGAACVVWSAMDTGVLAELGDEPRSGEEIARALALDPERTVYVLDVLVSEGVAARGPAGYVRSDSMQYLHSMMGPLSSSIWLGLPGIVRGDAPAWAMDIDPEVRGQLYRDVTPKLGELFAGAAEELADALGPAGRVLDLGCGSGVWGLALAARDADAEVTGVDFETVLVAMKDRADAMGLSGRVTLHAADLTRDALPSGFDTVVVANVLRLEPEEVASDILRRACDCVAEGGRIVVIDALASGSPSARRSVALYALNLGLRTSRGQVHDAQRVRRWLGESGMTDVHEVELTREPEHLGVLVGRR